MISRPAAASSLQRKEIEIAKKADLRILTPLSFHSCDAASVILLKYQPFQAENACSTVARFLLKQFSRKARTEDPKASEQMRREQ